MGLGLGSESGLGSQHGLRRRGDGAVSIPHVQPQPYLVRVRMRMRVRVRVRVRVRMRVSRTSWPCNAAPSGRRVESVGPSARGAVG